MDADAWHVRDRRLIDEMLPIREISEAGAAEKGRGTGRINNLHRWWATRPTTVSRIAAYASLIPPPLAGHEDMIRGMLDYAGSTDRTKPAIRERARSRVLESWGGAPKVLDPFGGSGALPFAAAWLGCESHSLDYNPVAVFMQRCALEYPAKYGARLLEDVREAAESILAEIRRDAGQFYPDAPAGGQTRECYGYRVCRTMPCVCGMTIPLVRSYTLAKNRGICLYPEAHGSEMRFRVVGGQYGPIPDGFDPEAGSVGGGVVKCPACGHTHTSREMHDMFDAGKAGEQSIAAVYVRRKRPGRYYAAVDAPVTCAAELERRRNAFRTKYGIDPVPSGTIPTPDGAEFRHGGPRWRTTEVVAHGYTRWEHLFNPRQLACLVGILGMLRRAEARLARQHGVEYGCVIMSYMALMLDKTVEKYCRLGPIGRHAGNLSATVFQSSRSSRCRTMRTWRRTAYGGRA